MRLHRSSSQPALAWPGGSPRRNWRSSRPATLRLRSLENGLHEVQEERRRPSRTCLIFTWLFANATADTNPTTAGGTKAPSSPGGLQHSPGPAISLHRAAEFQGRPQSDDEISSTSSLTQQSEHGCSCRCMPAPRRTTIAPFCRRRMAVPTFLTNRWLPVGTETKARPSDCSVITPGCRPRHAIRQVDFNAKSDLIFALAATCRYRATGDDGW